MARQRIDWIITDTHFYHDNMVELCNRPVNFNELLIMNLKHLIASQDRLFHLGDVILYRYTELKSILDSIRGQKILLMGNHDHKSPGWYSRNGFDFVADMIVIDNVLLSHKPIERLPTGVDFNIHGHWHNINPPKPDWWNPKTHKLLAVEHTNYKPIKLIDFVNKAKEECSI